MHRTLLALSAILVLSAGHAPAGDGTGTPQLVKAANITQNMSALLNAERQREGRAPLARSKKLDKSAQRHADDMARKGYFSHTAPDGTLPRARAKRVGYRACLIAENISYGRPSTEAVVAAWMRSPGHRKNMLLKEVTEFGAGHAAGDIWVIVLARPGC